MDTIKVFDVEIKQDSIREFQESLREAREAMKDAKIGSTEFAQELRKLEEVQNKYRNALKLGTDDTYKAGESYNALTRRMSELKSIWRATTDEIQRAKLGREIASINTTLKDLDKTVGDNYRNVGNYVSVWEGIGGVVANISPGLAKVEGMFSSIGTASKVFAKLIGSATSAVGFLSKGLKILKANLLATGLGALVVLLGEAVANWDKLSKALGITSQAQKAQIAIDNLNKTLEDNEQQLKGKNIDAIHAYTAALREAKGDIEAIDRAEKQYNTTLLENRKAIAEANVKAANEAFVKALDANTKRDNKKTRAALEEANKMMQEARDELAEVNNDIAKRDADTQAKSVENARRAAEERKKIRQQEEEERKKEDEARANAERIIAENNAQAEAELLAIRQQNRERTFENDMLTLEENHAIEMAALQKRIDDEQIAEETANALKLETERAYQIERQAIRDEYNAQALTSLEEWAKEEAEIWQSYGENIIAEYEKQEKKKKALADEAAQEEEQRKKIAKQLMQEAAQTLGENTAAGKALAIANTIMNTYESATLAYKAMAGIPYVGPALGAAAAGTAITMGMANVKQIMATDASGKSTPSLSGATSSVPAVVNPPAVIQEVPVVRSLTSASEEERLNKMASDQRVYVIYSDIARAGKHVEVQQTESSF